MVEVYFSPGVECLKAILDNLERARKQVDLCIFTISDDRITFKIKKLHEKGLRVRIITDNDKLNDKGSDIEELAKAGIPLRVDRTRAHMHHKFAVIDKKRILTGSYNWTRSAEKYNHENVLLSDQSKAVKAYQTEFDKLWEQMEDFDG